MKKIIAMLIFLFFLVGNRHACSPQADYLQRFCENLLKKDNIKGVIIVYDVKKDKIIALTSPNIAYKNYYQMGSVFKIISAFALYQEKIINYSTQINCRNYYKVNSKDFICAKPGGHGHVALKDAIGNSCSVYFYNFYDKLTSEKLAYYARLFLDNDAYKCRINMPSNGDGLADMIVGEGGYIQVHPVQMINLLKHLVKEDIKVNEKYYLAVKKGMRFACMYGTAKNINTDAAGKTGTPSDINHKGKFHGWFIGWAPAKDPKAMVVVFLEDGKGYEAAQIAGKVLRQYGVHLVGTEQCSVPTATCPYYSSIESIL